MWIFTTSKVILTEIAYLFNLIECDLSLFLANLCIKNASFCLIIVIDFYLWYIYFVLYHLVFCSHEVFLLKIYFNNIKMILHYQKKSYIFTWSIIILRVVTPKKAVQKHCKCSWIKIDLLSLVIPQYLYPLNH